MAKYHPSRISRIPPHDTAITNAERMLWNELRVLRDDGLNFRRRVPVDGHTVDFFCKSAGLAVQIEGQGDQTYASALNRFIQNRGFAIVQVTPADVELDPGSVARSIFDICQQRGHELFTLV